MEDKKTKFIDTGFVHMLIRALELRFAYSVDKTYTELSTGLLLAQRKQQGLCPQCGHNGQFIRAALVCPTHGAYAGC